MVPANCNGYGRIRHFRLQQFPDWSSDPLPIVPASRALGFSPQAVLRAQVFQVGACNWRCWYCFVDFNRLSADTRFGLHLTADELVQLYLEVPDRPQVIDLSGGQPDLVPEWGLWMMEALEHYALAERVFLWADDNLSTRFLWDYLTPKERQSMAAFPHYARVACFKGYDDESFSFNTRASPEGFREQLAIYRSLLAEGFDMYAYVTFTAVPHSGVDRRMAVFVDELQRIHHNLPLRTVPLRIQQFHATKTRIKSNQLEALSFQESVHHAWCEEMTRRFSTKERELPVCDVSIR